MDSFETTDFVNCAEGPFFREVFTRSVSNGFILLQLVVTRGHVYLIKLKLHVQDEMSQVARSLLHHYKPSTLIYKKFTIYMLLYCSFCSARRRTSEFFVVVGAHRLNLRGLEESWLFPREIHIHPSYRSPLVRKWSHDLALIELRNEHPFHKTGRPACLPTSRPPYINEHCLVLGWGQTESELL